MKVSPHSNFIHRLLSLLVFLNGVLLLTHALALQIILPERHIGLSLRVNVGVFAGLTLVYLSTLLRRRKQNAWLVTITVYSFTLGVNVTSLVFDMPRELHLNLFSAIRTVIVPAVILLGLLLEKKKFTAKSDVRSFNVALRTVSQLLLALLVYGVIGFMLLDERGFHRSISFWQALHFTIDRFALTTEPIVAQTAQARLFISSLAFVSLLAAAYTLVAFFQPIRMRLGQHKADKELMERLLKRYSHSSEDYFKLWPADKAYYFSPDKRAGLAFHVTRGVALVVGDPVGPPHSQNQLLKAFEDLCFTNDWLPCFVLVTPAGRRLLETREDYGAQKLGEEAVVELNTFTEKTVRDKYFRNITNRFSKAGYRSEYLAPPHSSHLLAELRQASDDWLGRPGRSERGLMMGYFSETYMQHCPVLVARDEKGVLQAFLNQVPSFVAHEANFDMLRYKAGAASNINDFLLIEFIKALRAAGYTHLNLGLSPLTGLEEGATGDMSGINRALHFLYENGGRFYSFAGLHRFKNKYDPKWRERYIICKGGTRQLIRSLAAVNKAMNSSPKLYRS